MSDSSYSYIDAPASAIELNTNKISEMSEEQTYDKEYPNAEAVKDYVAEHSGGGENVEHTTNKVTEIDEESTDIQYPSAKCVYSVVDEIAAQVNSIAAAVEYSSNKVTSITENSTNNQYPSAKCAYDNLQLKENANNKVTEIDENSTDEQYPSAKCVFDGIAGLASDLSQILEGVEYVSHKVTSISSSSTDIQYPSAKCVYDLLSNLDVTPTRLITTRTLSEDTRAITVTTDDNNNALSLSEFEIAIKIPASASLANLSYVSTRIRVNNDNAWSTQMNNNTVIGAGTEGKEHRVIIEAKIKNMRWEYMTASIKNTNTAASVLCNGTPDNRGYVLSGSYNDVALLKCSRIEIAASSSSGVIPTGTVIEIYGK